MKLRYSNMILYLFPEDVSVDIHLPKEGWETVIWLRSWSDISNDVFYHLIRISHVENIKNEFLYQAHFQIFRNNDIRKFDLLEELTRMY